MADRWQSRSVGEIQNSECRRNLGAKNGHARVQCVVAFAISLLLLPASNDQTSQAELQSCVVASWSRSLVVSIPANAKYVPTLHTTCRCNNGRSEINSIPVLHVVASTHSFTSFAGSSCCSQAQTTLFSSLAAPIGTSPAHTTSQLPWTDSDERERYYVVTDEPRTHKGQKERERDLGHCLRLDQRHFLSFPFAAVGNTCEATLGVIGHK